MRRQGGVVERKGGGRKEGERRGKGGEKEDEEGERRRGIGEESRREGGRREEGGRAGRGKGGKGVLYYE